MNHEKKTRLLVYISITIAAVAALSVVLEGFNLQRGLPVLEFGAEERGSEGVYLMLLDGEFIFRILRGMLASILLLLIVLVIYPRRKFKGSRPQSQTRRRMLTHIIMLLIFLVTIQVMNNPTEQEEVVVDEELESLALVQNPGSELERVTPPDVASAAAVAFTFLLAGGVTLWLWLSLRPKGPLSGEDSHLEALAREAQLAVDSLLAGEDFKDVIIQCYARMGLLLQKERRIRREQAMTPREFIRHLESKGIPSRPVRQLTHLFEEVRYGRREHGTNEEQLALLSLNEIVQFCREAESAG
jgi:hypothetical protein